jgi:hypothetical protein
MRINQRWTPEVLVWPASVSLLTLLSLHQDNSLASFFITEGQEEICTEGSKGNEGPLGDDKNNKRKFSQKITKVTKGIWDRIFGADHWSIDWFPFSRVIWLGEFTSGLRATSSGEFLDRDRENGKASRTSRAQTPICRMANDPTIRSQLPFVIFASFCSIPLLFPFSPSVYLLLPCDLRKRSRD